MAMHVGNSGGRGSRAWLGLLGRQCWIAGRMAAFAGRVSGGWCDGGEGPGAVEDLGARAVQADHVVPAIHVRQAVRPSIGAAAEADGDRPAVAGNGSDVVDGVGAAVVGLKVPFCVV